VICVDAVSLRTMVYIMMLMISHSFHCHRLFRLSHKFDDVEVDKVVVVSCSFGFQFLSMEVKAHRPQLVLEWVTIR